MRDPRGGDLATTHGGTLTATKEPRYPIFPRTSTARIPRVYRQSTCSSESKLTPLDYVPISIRAVHCDTPGLSVDRLLPGMGVITSYGVGQARTVAAIAAVGIQMQQQLSGSTSVSCSAIEAV